jgi:diguanylate cyclase (GGDEF)-like protein
MGWRMRAYGTLACLAGIVLAMVLPCGGARAAGSSTAAPSAASLLAQAEDVWTSDPARYRHIMARLHRPGEVLSAEQRWHLHLLDARQLSFDGDYDKADPLLRDIIDHAGQRPLSVRATALLMLDKFLSHQYVDAYALANTLMAELPTVTDPTARLESVDRIISMLNGAAVGQYDQALQYARQLKAVLPSAAARCVAELGETDALLYAGKIGSTSPRFRQAIDACRTAGQPLKVEELLLNQASAMIDEGHANRSLALLHRMTPEILKHGFPPYLASLQVTQAQAYLSLGDTAKARKFALVSSTMPGAKSARWIMQAAYEVLYEATKMDGRAAAALAYYEKYVALQKAAMDDAKARALAYQMVRQQVQAKKMQVDALDKQNRILQLRQELARQAQRTSRLLIALLLAAIAFITLAVVWLWHSRLRFRRMARHDGLTGMFNREHFLAQAEHVLRRRHRAKAGVCLVVMDLDHFKRVNDTHGHVAGDVVLRQAATCCRNGLRAGDVCGRLGGEEFGILIPAASCEEGAEIVARIRRTLGARPVVLGSGASVTVSASFGLAWSADASHDLRQLLIDADAALYCAKEGGRDRVVVSIGGDAPEIVADEAVLAAEA